MSARRPVEIAVQDPAGARAAIGAGAARLELCQALDVGGLTPSLAILEGVLAAVDPSTVNVLVRPRGGGFVYSPRRSRWWPPTSAPASIVVRAAWSSAR